MTFTTSLRLVIVIHSSFQAIFQESNALGMNETMQWCAPSRSLFTSGPDDVPARPDCGSNPVSQRVKDPVPRFTLLLCMPASAHLEFPISCSSPCLTALAHLHSDIHPRMCFPVSYWKTTCALHKYRATTEQDTSGPAILFRFAKCCEDASIVLMCRSRRLPDAFALLRVVVQCFESGYYGRRSILQYLSRQRRRSKVGAHLLCTPSLGVTASIITLVARGAPR
jgi:hypothetical protein